MSGVLALLAGVSIVGFHAHRPLLWLAGRRVDPTILLTGWVLATVGLVASTVATVTLVALPADDHPSSGIFALAGGCWTALSSGVLPGWREALAALSIMGATGILLRLAWAIRGRINLRRAQTPHLEQLRLLASGSASDEPLWVRAERPFAMSIGGRPGIILMSTALRQELPAAAITATLEHERAHLRGRHHALVAVAEVLAAALPICPLLRTAPSAIRDLVEHAADAEAARRCGTAAVREALCRLTGHPTPVGTLAMASGLTEARLLRLTTEVPRSNRVLRFAGCAAVALGALLLPTAAGWLAVNVAGCVVT